MLWGYSDSSGTYIYPHPYILSSWCTVVLVLVVVNCPVTLSSWVSASPPGWRSSHPTWTTPERKPLSSSTMLTSSWYGQARTIVIWCWYLLFLSTTTVCNVFLKKQKPQSCVGQVHSLLPSPRSTAMYHRLQCKYCCCTVSDNSCGIRT